MPHYNLLEDLQEQKESLLTRAEDKINNSDSGELQDFLDNNVSKALVLILESSILGAMMEWQGGNQKEDEEVRARYLVMAYKEVLGYLEDIPEWMSEIREQEKEK